MSLFKLSPSHKNKKNKMVGLSDIPEEVISHHLLQHLGLNALLRLRRVSKYYKCLADDFMNLNVVTDQVVLIASEMNGFGYGYDFDNKDRDPENLARRHIKKMSLSQLLELPIKIPSSNFEFEYDPENDVFRHQQILDFVKLYGKQITRLKLKNMIVPIKKETEKKFYQGLPNLRDLTIDSLRVSEAAARKDLDDLYIPPIFKNLTRLSVKCYIEINRNDQHKMCYWKILKSCDNLKILGQPLYSILDINQIEDDLDPHFGSFVLNELTKMINEKELGQGKLTCIDMFYMNFQGPDHYWTRVEETEFVPFLSACFHNQINLENFPDALLAKLSEQHFQKATLCITSVKGLTPNILKIDLPLLEKVSINTEECYMNGDAQDVGNNFLVPTQTWPNLSTINVTVSSVLLSNGFWDEEEWTFPTTVVWNQLFGEDGNFERPSVTNLNLIFTRPRYQLMQAIPSSAAIANSCKMLRILSLTRWPGDNDDMRILWRELSNLEEITFDECKNLTIAAFYGDDTVPHRSHFVNLKHLKKLSIYNLHEMRGITDAVFQKIFCHLKVRHFYLESKFIGQVINLESFTFRSMKALAEGEFAKTVETFPFYSWAIHGLKAKKIMKIRKKFPLLNATEISPSISKNL